MEKSIWLGVFGEAMRGAPWGGAWTIGALFVFVGTIPDVAAAESISTENARLPTGRSLMGVVPSGSTLYIIGGWDLGGASSSSMTQVLAYDTETRSLASLATKAPRPLYGASMAMLNGKAYFFGGWAASDTKSPKVEMFDPLTQSFQTMSASLPSGRYTTAVAHGSYIYLLGGKAGTADSPIYLDSILRYDPAVDSLEEMPSSLHTPLSAGAAISDGSAIYYFSGSRGSDGFYFDQIIRYDPSVSAVEILNAKLPSKRTSVSATWDGKYAYIAGGQHKGPNDEKATYSSQILRFDPSTQTITSLSAQLPGARAGHGDAWLRSRVWFVGGHYSNEGARDDILKLDPSQPSSSTNPQSIPTPSDSSGPTSAPSGFEGTANPGPSGPATTPATTEAPPGVGDDVKPFDQPAGMPSVSLTGIATAVGAAILVLGYRRRA